MYGNIFFIELFFNSVIESLNKQHLEAGIYLKIKCFND